MGYKESLNDFINSQNWIFSRTMADAPHWYCLKAQCESEGAWGWFVRFMDMYGVEDCDLINRCVIPCGEMRPENFPAILNA